MYMEVHVSLWSDSGTQSMPTLQANDFFAGKKSKANWSDYYNLVLLCDKVTLDASPSQRNSQPAIKAAMKIHPEVEF